MEELLLESCLPCGRGRLVQRRQWGASSATMSAEGLSVVTVTITVTATALHLSQRGEERRLDETAWGETSQGIAEITSRACNCFHPLVAPSFIIVEVVASSCSFSKSMEATFWQQQPHPHLPSFGFLHPRGRRSRAILDTVSARSAFLPTGCAANRLSRGRMGSRHQFTNQLPANQPETWKLSISFFATPTFSNQVVGEIHSETARRRRNTVAEGEIPPGG